MSKFNYSAPPAMELLGPPRRVSESSAAQKIETYLELATGMPITNTASQFNGGEQISPPDYTKPPKLHLHPDCVFTHGGPSLDGRPASGGRVFEQMKRMAAGLRGEKLSADPSLLFGGEDDADPKDAQDVVQDAQVKSYNEQMMDQGDDGATEGGLEEEDEVQELPKSSKKPDTDPELVGLTPRKDEKGDDREVADDTDALNATTKSAKRRRKLLKQERDGHDKEQTALRDTEDVADALATDTRSSQERDGRENIDRKTKKKREKEKRLEKIDKKLRRSQKKSRGKREHSVEL